MGCGPRSAAELPAVVVTTGYTADEQFVGAAEVRAGYDGPEPLLAAGCPAGAPALVDSAAPPERPNRRAASR